MSRSKLCVLFSVFFLCMCATSYSASVNLKEYIHNRLKKNYTKKGSANRDKKIHVVCITIPKSGTHLLHKALVSLVPKGIVHPDKDGPSEAFMDKIREKNQNPPPNHYKGLFHVPTVGPVPGKIAHRLKTEPLPIHTGLIGPIRSKAKNYFPHIQKLVFL